jgi:luciferase family oxidoreductase group 1
MLSHYAALKVAENFRMLETLYPGRIDLGIGRAPGSDRLTAQALAHGAPMSIDQFPQQLVDLVGYLRNELPPDHPFHDVRTMPEGPGDPEIWLLGSSDQSAAYAAYLGFAFSFAHFINPHGGPDVMTAYRQHFRPSGRLAAPLGSVGISVMCAETHARAEELAACLDLWRLRNEQGRPGPVPTVEEALSHPYTEHERVRARQVRSRTIVGEPAAVRPGLEALAAQYEVEELVIVTICPDFESRRRSYELLAEAFELTPR